MPAFQAINLEPEENIDEQIDTTKEFHVDEALKRFQNALKLHAQGLRSREAACAAYDELFESEIFKYREAKTEYERAELQANGQAATSAPESFADGLDVAAGGADGVAASLALALYLSYKNHGQFYLDRLKDEQNSNPEWSNKLQIYYRSDQGKKVLDSWTAALDQDPSDPELWRKMARFAGALNSGRIKRYCLEAAIELDDDPAVMEVDPPSLAESLAGEQLKMYLDLLSDKMALSHPAMAPWIKKRLPSILKRHLDPIPFLPDPTSTLSVPPELQISKQLPQIDNADETISVLSDVESSSRDVGSWPDLGFELMKCVESTKDALEVCRLILQTAKQDTEMDEARDEAADEPENGTLPRGGKAAGTNGNNEKASATTSAESKGSRASDTADDAAKGSDGTQKESSVLQSARKRSQSTAGIPDGADEENVIEKRSKRVRRRVETSQAEEVPDPSTLIANQLRPFQEADQHLFTLTKNLLETIGVEDKATFEYLDEVLNLCVAEDRSSKFTRVGAKDLRTLIVDFKGDVAMVFLNKKEQATLGLSSFLEHAKTGSEDQIVNVPFNEAKGLRDFAYKVEKRHEQMTSGDIVLEWMKTISSSYASFKWSDVMKTAVVQMLNTTDSSLYRLVSEELQRHSSPEELADLESLIPMVFELYIDIYERITNPSSAVDYATRMETKYRLQRWLDLASAYVRLMDRPPADPLCVRFLWASVLVSSLSDNPVREHILLMWTSLRDFLTEEKVDTLTLPNNVVMPTISPAAADREISKLTTMDFFLSLFQEGMESPVHVIETLEPVLNPSSVCISVDKLDDSADSDASSSADLDQQKNKQCISDCATQGMRDLWKFLRSSSTELRLFLWSRLGDAYEAIKYTTKRFSCHLRSIELIVADLESEKYAKLPDESRLLLYMRTLKSLDELLIQALTLALNDPSAFDIIDDDHLKSSCSALAKVNSILHVGFLCEDEVRIGAKTAPSSNSTYQSLIIKLREMQVRTWCLQFTMFRAGLSLQESIAPEKDQADFLAAVHQVIGLRKCCKASNKIFLKVMRMELLKNKNIENWEDYLGQVVYDLYGLKLGVGVWEVQDHGCPHEKLEKRQTMQLVEKIMILANRMPMKDLLKSDLKTAIDHMQQTIGQPKSTAQMIHNLRNFTELVKKPIHPLRLYQALVGEVSVDAVSTNTPEAALAKHGWFFLLGMIALTKFKAVDLNRRQTPGATDDLRIGATFLRLQLQFSSDNWESWFRLAECFDYDLDEAVLWTADKMNKDRAELVKFQRNAIHCYTLALSHSRYQDIEANDEDPLHDLYHKFGMRLYASSREPFAMEPFQHSDQERFFIQNMGAGTFKKILHEQMTEYKVWKYAAKLFRMAIERKPGNWKNSYMLAKCYWKMYQTPDEELDSKDRDTKIGVQTVLKALKDAVSVAHKARKSRNSDPILEPHYKIVSIVHKLVMREDLSAREAAEILSEQPFGVQFKPEDHFASFTEPEDWEEYIIPTLVKLKEKDKSNWQHRIVARHAKILFDENSMEQVSDLKMAAQAAFAILRENMFTKTMVMNVWKCDAERPGRHHVFTEQYVRFMTNLLVIMSDKTNLEQLLRRLRKKGADFYHFVDLWQSCCMAYLKLLRDAHSIPHSNDDAFKALSTEEFEIISERITDWAARDEANVPAFLCMKEAIELKKLNANLMKVAGIDDLINDCYSKIYVDVAGTLPGQEPSKIIEERNQAKEIAAKLEAAAAAAAAAQADPKPTSSLSNILNPPSTHDSLPGTATPLEGEKSEAAPRTRKTGVRRPDILRKAEQAVTRSLETPKLALPRSRVGSLSSAKRDSQTPNAGVSDADSDDEGPDAQVRREAGEDTDMPDTHAYEEDGHDGHDDSKLEEKEELESDDAHSLDDSAEESDLSDVPDDYEEDVPPSLMFPHLGRTVQSGEASGEDADSESEGDEDEGEGEGVEEEEEDEEEEEVDDDEDDEEEGHGEDEAEEAEEGEEEHDQGDLGRETHEDGEEEEEEDEDDEEDDEEEEVNHGVEPEDIEMAEPHTPTQADHEDSVDMGT